MAIYLLVAYQTAQSPQLLAATQELSRADPSARFVLLVPATPASGLLSQEEADPAGLARRRAASARTRLENIGVQRPVADVASRDPLLWLSRHRARHDGDHLGSRVGFRRKHGTPALPTTASSQSVGLVMTVITNPHFTEVVQGIENELARNGCGLLLGDSHDDPERELRLLH